MGLNIFAKCLHQSYRQITQIALLNCLTMFITLASGCSLQDPKLSTAKEYEEFEKAGPASLQFDKRLLTAAYPVTAYKLFKGDVLEVQLFSQPLQVNNQYGSDSRNERTFQCRIDEKGQAMIPLIGKIDAVGKGIDDFENQVAEAYYPKLLVNKPSVTARVVEYRKYPVTVVGGVKNPGVYDLNNDRMMVVPALIAAGGVVEDGARVIRIHRVAKEDETFQLPVIGLNIPFKDVALQAGDVVEVEKLDQPVFTVIGLVSKPGAYPYPVYAKYNLLQSLAYAGGVNFIADPKYVTVYRQNAAGKIIAASFELNGSDRTISSSTVQIKPGDVVAVEQTAGTWARLFAAEVLRFQFGYSKTN